MAPKSTLAIERISSDASTQALTGQNTRATERIPQQRTIFADSMLLVAFRVSSTSRDCSTMAW